MMDYQTAVRGAFFDIAGVAETPDEVAAQARYLDDGLLFLQEGKIIALLPWLEGEAFLHPLKGYVDLRGKLLLPGFVDAHVHYPQTEMIGAFGEQLLEWLTTYTFPVESQFADAEYAQEIAQFFVNQLISHGTTTALVFCTLHPASVEALFSEALRLNMRLIAGKVMMDRHVPDYLCETAGESYEQTRALILDEPTNHLDVKYQLQLLNTVKSLDLTVVAAFHDLNLAGLYCDEIYVLKDGRVRAAGAPWEVLTAPLIEEVYGVHADILPGKDGNPRIIYYAG